MHGEIADVVLLGAILLAVASIVGAALHRFNFPFTIALVLVGWAVGQLARFHEFELLSHFELPPDLVFFVLLPALLFESAFNMEVRRLVRDLSAIVTLAVFGLLVCVAVVAAALVLGVGIALPLALLCGALVSATDPVAVIGMFKQLGTPKRLNVLIEGESLFNDGTAIVVFRLIQAVALGAAFGPKDALLGVAQFFGVCLGGIALGLLSGHLFSAIVSVVDEQPSVEVTFSVLTAYTTFLAAEHFFHVSGVIATVVAGLVMGGPGRSKFSPDTREFLEEFWEYAAFVANSLVFLLVGMSVVPAAMYVHAPAILWGILGTLVARAVAAYVLIPAVNRRVKSPDIDRRFQTIIFWGDLRGALALAMALTLPESFVHREFVLSFALGLVLFTLLVKGLTLRGLMRLLKLDRLTLGEVFEKEEALLMSLRSAGERVRSLAEHGEMSKRMSAQLLRSHEEWATEARHELEALRESMGEGAALRERVLLERHCYALARAEVEGRFTGGEVGERAKKTVEHWLEDELDWLRSGHRQPLPLPEPLTRWERWVVEHCDAWGLPVLLCERLEERSVALHYQAYRATVFAARAVLGELETMTESGAISREQAREVGARFRQLEKQAADETEAMHREHPRWVAEVQTTLAANFALRTERALLEELHAKGVVSDKVMAGLEEEIAGKLHRVRHLRIDEGADAAGGEAALTELGRLSVDTDSDAVVPDDE